MVNVVKTFWQPAYVPQPEASHNAASRLPGQLRNERVSDAPPRRAAPSRKAAPQHLPSSRGTGFCDEVLGAAASQRSFDDDDRLLTLAIESLKLGHWKVALRRLLMRVMRSGKSSKYEETLILRLSASCTRRELHGMVQAAAAWASMVNGPMLYHGSKTSSPQSRAGCARKQQSPRRPP